MWIPEHLAPLLRQLAAEHWAFQVRQVRMLGHDHPQARCARQHLNDARDLARAVGADTSVAA